MPATKFWEHVKSPHPAALNNLRTITSYLVEQGAIQPGRTKSAYTIATDTNISYNQVLNLIKKPGFVRVFGPSGTSMGYFYAVTELGSPYPDKFSPGLKIPREVSFVEPVITNPEVAAEVARANASTGGQPSGIDTTGVQFPTGDLKLSALRPVWDKLLTAIISGDRTPEQAAGFVYVVSSQIHTGRTTIVED